AAIVRATLFGVVGVDGPLFAEALRLQAPRFDAGFGEPLHHGRCAPLAEPLVVRRAALAVGVALDAHFFDLGVVFQDLLHGLQNEVAGLQDLRAIERELHLFADDDLVRFLVHARHRAPILLGIGIRRTGVFGTRILRIEDAVTVRVLGRRAAV